MSVENFYSGILEHVFFKNLKIKAPINVQAVRTAVLRVNPGEVCLTEPNYTFSTFLSCYSQTIWFMMIKETHKKIK